MDHQARSIYLSDSASLDNASHIFRFADQDSSFMDAVPLWRLAWGGHAQIEDMAALDAGHLAISWVPASRIEDGVLESGAGITVFDSVGQITSISRIAEDHAPIAEAWQRTRIAAVEQVTVLYPRSSTISDTLGMRYPVPPFAMDIAVDGNQRMASRGWNGVDGVLHLVTPTDVQWERTARIGLATGVALSTRYVHASDPIQGVIARFGLANGDDAVALQSPSGEAGWPVDIAASGDQLISLGPSGRIDLWFENAMAPHRTWTALGEGSYRAVAMNDSQVGVLVDGRHIELWSLEGLYRGRIETGLAAGSLSDISFGESGNVVALDAESRQLLTYETSSAQLTPPEPVPDMDGDPWCELIGDKQVSPTSVTLGQPVTVTLSLQARCPERPDRVDVVLVWSPSSTFWYDYKYQRVREAIERLTRALDEPAVRLGLVGIAPSEDGPSVLLPLGTSQQSFAGMGDRFARSDFERQPEFHRASTFSPVEHAQEYLESAGVPGAAHVIVYVGMQPLSERDTEAVRDFVADGGSYLSLQTPDRFDAAIPSFIPLGDRFVAVHDGDVAELAWRIQSLTRPVFPTQVDIVDRLEAVMQLEPGSVLPLPVSTGSRELRWLEGSLESDWSARFRIEPQAAGIYPVSEVAVADYDDADGRRRRFVFPRPEVEVLAPTPTETPRQHASSTPSATATPKRAPELYLPVVHRNQVCSELRAPTDVVLVLDRSSSMVGPKIDAAKRASTVFLEQLDLSRDQLGIVAFDEAAELIAPLQSDQDVLVRSIDGIEVHPGTRVDRGLERAFMELQSKRARSNALPVAILLADGRQEVEAQRAINLAEAARGDGVTTYAIGLGGDVDHIFLGRIAGRGDRYLHAPSPLELEEIYASIATSLPCPQ